MRRAAKVDRNHAVIRDHLRGRGWSVHDTSALGAGFGDLVVARYGHTAVLEIKDGSADVAEHKLTAYQRDFRNKWQGAYFVVTTPDHAVKQLNLWLLSHSNNFAVQNESRE